MHAIHYMIKTQTGVPHRCTTMLLLGVDAVFSHAQDIVTQFTPVYVAKVRQGSSRRWFVPLERKDKHDWVITMKLLITTSV